MSKILVQPPDSTCFNEFLAYAKESGFGMEIADFAHSGVLDSNWQEILRDYQGKLKDFKGTLSLHGVFMDVGVHSIDEKVRKIAEDRTIHNLKIAEALNADSIVFHGNFNPLIGHKSYNRNWLKHNIQFWSEALEKFSLTILIENLWDPSPEIFRQLIDEVQSDRLKICFDVAHAHIFSKVPLEDWFSTLRDDIPYIHVSDNDGNVDSELVPGKGSIDWQKFSNLIQKYRLSPAIVFEVSTLENTIQAVEYCSKHAVYPFDASTTEL